MSEQNKAIVRRLFEELWNKGNLSVADQLFSCPSPKSKMRFK